MSTSNDIDPPTIVQVPILIIVPSVLMLSAVFDLAWVDLIDSACDQRAEESKTEGAVFDLDKCIAIGRRNFIFILAFSSLFQLYCAYILKMYADQKKEQVYEPI